MSSSGQQQQPEQQRQDAVQRCKQAIDDIIANSSTAVDFELEVVYQGRVDWKQTILSQEYSHIRGGLFSNDFSRLFQELPQYGWDKQPEETSLYVFTHQGNQQQRNQIRAIIPKSHLQEYCNKNDSLNQVPVGWNEKTEIAPPLFIDEFYNFKLNYKKETNLLETHPSVRTLTASWDNFYKKYRYRQRHRFIHTRTPFFAIDLTVLKSNMSEHTFSKTLKTSKTLRQPETFEIEIELLSTKVKEFRPTAEDVIEQLFEVMKLIETIIDNVPVKKENFICKQVMTLYVQQLHDSIHSRQPDLSSDDIHKLLVKKNLFVGPDVTSISHYNLSPHADISITKEYSLLYKTDGERHLGIIFNNELFLLNNRFDMKYTGIRIEGRQLLNGTIVDGELVIKGNLTPDEERWDDDVYWYYIFDYYFGSDGDNRIHDYRFHPLLRRFDELNRINGAPIEEGIINKKFSSLRRKVTPKKLYQINEAYPTIQSVCKAMLQHSLLEYKTDGLIFTPHAPIIYAMGNNNLSPLLQKQEAKQSLTSTTDMMWFVTGKRWGRMLKWKPPKDNTIDFLAIKQHTSTVDNVPQNTYLLYNGYDLVTNPISIFDILQGKYLVEHGQRIGTTVYNQKFIMDGFYPENVQTYERREFRPTRRNIEQTIYQNAKFLHVPLDGGRARCENQEEIQDECIVELYYDNHQWVPRNVRHDKTEQYYRNNKLTNIGNNFAVADSIFRSYFNPITEEMITNENIVSAGDDNSDEYYVFTEREKRLSKALTGFHNQIKERLIQSTLKQIMTDMNTNKIRVLDLCCGKGGDLLKFSKKITNEVHSPVAFYVGVDYMVNGLEGVSNACQRYVEGLYSSSHYQRGKRRPQIPITFEAYFLQGDASKRLSTGECTDYFDYKELYKQLWGSSDTVMTWDDPMFSKNRGKPAKDYAWYREPINGKANGGFHLVSTQFAIHYMFRDQSTLHGYLQNVSDNLMDYGYLIGTTFEGERVVEFLRNTNSKEYVENDEYVWKLEKQYNDAHLSEVYGQQISVYMDSIGKNHAEYLMFFETLKREAEKFNLYMLDPSEQKKSFETWYRELRRGGDSSSREDMSPELKELSFLNISFVFQKFPFNPRAKFASTKKR